MPKWIWLAGGGVGVLGLGFWLFRERELDDAVDAAVTEVVSAGGAVVAAAQKLGLQAFLTASGNAAAPYGAVIDQVANEQNISPFVIVALGDRETRWGMASAYRNQTGDYAKRAWTSAQIEKVPVTPVGTAPAASDGSPRWYVMPADGLGWGRGLMQVDYASWYDWLASNDWRDPYVNITKGVQILKQKMKYLAGKGLVGDDLTAAGLAAYNAGEGNVWKAWSNAIAQGQNPRQALDKVTTGGDYSASVLTTIANLTNAYAMAEAAQPTEGQA